MKKIIISIVLLLTVGTYNADVQNNIGTYAAEICFTIDNGKIQRIIDAMWEVHGDENPLINIGTEENPIWEKKYTPNQWAKICIRNWIMRQVERNETTLGIDTVKQRIDSIKVADGEWITVE